MTLPPRPHHSDQDATLDWLTEVFGRAIIEPRRAPDSADPVSLAQKTLWDALPESPAGT